MHRVSAISRRINMRIYAQILEDEKILFRKLFISNPASIARKLLLIISNKASSGLALPRQKKKLQLPSLACSSLPQYEGGDSPLLKRIFLAQPVDQPLRAQPRMERSYTSYLFLLLLSPSSTLGGRLPPPIHGVHVGLVGEGFININSIGFLLLRVRLLFGAGAVAATAASIVPGSPCSLTL